MIDITDILIIDDDELQLDMIRQSIQKIRPKWKIHCFTCAETALRIVMKKKIALLFIDIMMPVIDGIHFIQSVKRNLPDIHFVFITNHATYALNGYEHYPLDFLLKPLLPARLEQTIQRFEKLEKKKGNLYQKSNTKIGIKTNKGIEFLLIDEILYIEKKSKKCKIYMDNLLCYETFMPLNELEYLLRNYLFFNPYRAFLIPISKIKFIEPPNYGSCYSIYLHGRNDPIPLAREKYRYIKKFFEII